MNVVPITGRLPEEQPKATHLPLCTVLTPELARCLEAVNSATRALRQAGIPIEQTSVLDRRLLSAKRIRCGCTAASATPSAAFARPLAGWSPSMSSACSVLTWPGRPR